MRQKSLPKEQRRAKTAFEFHQLLSQIEKERRGKLLDMGFMLAQIKAEQLYKDILGDEKATWTAYLSQVEVMMTRHRVKSLIEVVGYFLIKRGFEISELVEYPTNRLIDIVKCAENDEQTDKLLEAARVALPQDWRDTLAEVTGKVTSENCEHDFADIKICEMCGKKIKQ